MELSTEQANQFHRDGFLLLERVFSVEEIDQMRNELSYLKTLDCPERILEKDGTTRSFFAPETKSVFFDHVVRQERMVEPSKRILASEVYVHQSKMNTKRAIVGDKWDWHQDFIFWHKDDGMPEPRVINAMIYLDEMTEFNGPLYVIPGSHRDGMSEEIADTDSLESESEWFKEYQNSQPYMSSLTANLKYTLSDELIREWADKNGIVSAKGPVGSVLFFHGNLFHASPNNVSPWDRDTLIVTYNSTENTLRDIADPRPGFLANRDFSAIKSLSRESLEGVLA
jgi:ectoine hydroxylase